MQTVSLAAGLAVQQAFLKAHSDWVASRRPATLPGDDGDRIVHPDRTEAEQAGIHLLAFLWILIPQLATTCLLAGRLRSDSAGKASRSQKDAFRAARELLLTRDAVIFGLAKLAESRDTDTGMHLERIALYSTRLAAAMRRDPRYQQRIDADFVRNIGVSSALHDIGKVGVEDAVLLKPARLTQEERVRIQTHAQRGADCICQIERRLGGSNFLAMAREIALCHHERWDGRGYPSGLSGDRIPLAARIVAVADVYDALRSRRVYKKARSHDECVRIIREEAGAHFDPDVVDVFLSIEQQFREISERCADDSRNGTGTGPRSDTGRLTEAEARILADVTETLPASTRVESASADRISDPPVCLSAGHSSPHAETDRL